MSLVKITLNKPVDIKVNTEKKSKQLLRVLEYANYEWCSGDPPTSKNPWEKYGKWTLISIGRSCDKPHRQRISFREITLSDNYISPRKFYRKQRITRNLLKQVNKYFESS